MCLLKLTCWLPNTNTKVIGAYSPVSHNARPVHYTTNIAFCQGYVQQCSASHMGHIYLDVYPIIEQQKYNIMQLLETHMIFMQFYWYIYQ